MRFLLDANMPRSAAGAIQRLGHEVMDVRDLGMGLTEDRLIADYARKHSLVIITRDFDFSDIRNYPPAK